MFNIPLMKDKEEDKFIWEKLKAAYEKEYDKGICEAFP